MLPRARCLGWFLALLCLVAGSTPAAWAARPVTYVWLFASDGPDAKEIAEKVTDEFEVALLDAGCVSLVERREIKKLFDHQKNELAISSTSALAAADRAELQARRADSVVFGRITEDFESGHIRIEVKLQTLTGETVAGKRVLLTKGKRLDAVERESMMQKLADDLCGSVGMEPAVPGGTTQPGGGWAALEAKTAELAKAAKAKTIKIGQPVSGRLVQGTANEYFLTGEDKVPLHFTVEARGSSFHLYIRFFDSQGRELAPASDVSGGRFIEVGFTPSKTGSYYFRVWSSYGVGDYAITMQRLEDVPVAKK